MSDLPETRPGEYFSKKHLLKREAIALAKLLSPFFTILAIVANYHEFVAHAVAINRVINGLIISAALYGVILIVARMVNAQIDFYVIERFGREAMQGVYMPQLLNEPWLQKRYVRHYLGHIANTGGTLASSMQQDAIENELHALSSEYEHKLELPQFIVGFMVAMGLLGTFVGLLDTLTSISDMLDGFGQGSEDMNAQVMRLVSKLKEPLGGMGTAFSASMFGLVTSLMLAIMMINLRRYISRVVACARNVMHDLTELSKGAGSSGSGSGVSLLTPDQIAALAAGAGGAGSSGGSERYGRISPATIADGDSSLQDMVYSLNDSSLTVASHIDALVQKIDGLMQSFEASLKLVQKQNDLLSSVPHLSDTSEKILKEMRDSSGSQWELQRLLQSLVDNSSDAARAQGELLTAVPTMSDMGNKLLKELRNIANGQNEQQRMSQMLVDATNHVAHAQGELLRYVPAMSQTGEKILGEVKAISGNQNEQQNVTKMLLDATNNAAQTQAELSRALPSIGETAGRIVGELKVVAGAQVEQQRVMQSLAEMNGHLVRSQDSIAKAVPAVADVAGSILSEVKLMAGVQSELQRLSQLMVDAGNHTAQAQSEILRAMPGIGENGEEMLNQVKQLFGGPAEQVKISQGLAEVVNSVSRVAKDLATSQRESQTTLATWLKGFDERLTRIEGGAGTFSQHLSDLKESFMKLGTYSAVAERISTGVGHHTLLLETLIKEDRNLQRRLVSIQQDMRERFEIEDREEKQGDDTLPPT